MSPYVGQIILVGFNYAPVGWAFCDGRLLSIAEYDTLFNLIGTTYGGDGETTFALPDLRGRVAIGTGQGPGLSNYTIGETGGRERSRYGSPECHRTRTRSNQRPDGNREVQGRPGESADHPSEIFRRSKQPG